MSAEMLWRKPIEVCWDKSLCWGEEGDRTDKAVRVDGGVGDASWETEQDEKEVDGVGHVEGDDVDELKCK